MKNKTFTKSSFIIAAAALLAANALAQDAAPTPAVVQTTATAPAAPSLSSGAAQVLQLQQAKISDSTITAFIQNSSTVYTLDANQIIYLKQQGVTDAIINTMLNHKGMAAATVSASTSTATVAPTVTYIQSTATYVPTSTVYVAPEPYYYPAYYNYPAYYGYSSWSYPAVSFSFGFGGWRGGGEHGGGGWRGGGGHGGGPHR